jgi:hypothetical protein
MRGLLRFSMGAVLIIAVIYIAAGVLWVVRL